MTAIIVSWDWIAGRIGLRWRRYITSFLWNYGHNSRPLQLLRIQSQIFSLPRESIMSTSASTSGIPQHTSVSALTPVMTHTTWSAPEMRIMNPMDESFGYTLSTSRSHESRHDRRQSIADVPPPYSEESAIPLPDYTLHAPEPVTLAMYLFKFGFCMSSLCILFQNLSSSIYDSIPPILDIWSLHPYVAFARTTHQHKWLGAHMDARENRRRAQGNHRHTARSRAQMGETMPMCHPHSYNPRCIRRSRCLGSPPPVIRTRPHGHRFHSSSKHSPFVYFDSFASQPWNCITSKSSLSRLPYEFFISLTTH